MIINGALINGELREVLVKRIRRAGAPDRYIELKSDEVFFSNLRATGQLTIIPYDQTIFWLAAIKLSIEDLAHATDNIARLTETSWADLAVKTRLYTYQDYAFARHVDYNNFYAVYLDYTKSTADHQILKKVAGTVTILATEAVDLAGVWLWVKFQAVGSTISSFRAPDAVSDPPSTPTLTVTDTDIATGRWGVKHYGHGSIGLTGLFLFLEQPTSDVPPPTKYFEVPIEGEGSMQDPLRPKLPRKAGKLVRIIPDKKKWNIFYYSQKIRGVPEGQILATGNALDLVHFKVPNLHAMTWSLLLPTPKGSPPEYVGIMRVWSAPEEAIYALKESGAKELSREEAIARAKRIDDRLHDADLESLKPDKKLVQEYIEWRESQFGILPDPRIVAHYLAVRKGW